jgi:peptidoglycan/xylan/chitin deacetylase (PgdA/CDA1 family)
MRIRGLGRIQNTIRTVQNRLGANAVILLYHRVTEIESDPQRLAVSPANFSQQMEVLAATTCPVPLETLPARLKKRKRSERPLSVVTFDDGYTDNLEQAAPILARYSIPATIFVATATINRPYEFWWDILERALLRPDLPARLELKIGDQIRTWVFDKESEPSGIWDVRQEPRRTSQKAYMEIAGHIRNLIPAEREKILTRLIEWSGISRQPRPDHQTMTEEELRRLTADGLISVGAHTVNHPVLSALKPADQMSEIMESRIRLEQILARPVTTFAYPYGRVQDYFRQTVMLVRKAGFTCACSNFPRLVNRWTDPLQLPRFVVGNWKGGLFERDLAKFLQTWC